jgi:predicted O-methyltransferase YrrM
VTEFNNAVNPNYPARMYGGQSARSQDDMDAIYRDVCSRFDPLPEVEITRAPSSTFFQRLGDEKLDFVYIDGDHSFEFVLQDLRLARASLKPGGIIVGDDYRWRDSDGTRSVEMAVQAFASQHGLKVELIGNQVLIRV